MSCHNQTENVIVFFIVIIYYGYIFKKNYEHYLTVNYISDNRILIFILFIIDPFSLQYFDYKCYYELKDYYDYPYKSDTASDFLEKYQPPENYNNILKTSPLITKLTDNLASDRFLFNYNRATICKYINYWLNTQIRSDNLNESYIEFFKSFADEFAKHKYSEKTYASNTCSKYFSLLDNVKYRRMQGLYDMYRLYDEIINPRKYNKNVNICSNLMAINNAYKNLAWEFKGDDELNKKLESFKNSDLKKAKGHDDTCGNNVLSNIEQVKLTYSPPKQSSVLQEENIERQVQSETANSRGLQKTVVLPNHTHETEASNEETLSELTQKTTEQPHQGEVRFPDVEPPEKEVAPAEVTQEQLYRSGFQENILPERQLYKSALLTQPRSLPFGTIYNEQYAENQGSPSDGIFNKMSGALSGFMSNVDPIPVVGVSGGMGALFLLFRYTPVGSFFRGGRGRAHRIPRSFNGQFPGFPDYYEYDGGYIGYGPMNINPLAE